MNLKRNFRQPCSLRRSDSHFSPRRHNTIRRFSPRRHNTIRRFSDSNLSDNPTTWEMLGELLMDVEYPDLGLTEVWEGVIDGNSVLIYAGIDEDTELEIVSVEVNGIESIGELDEEFPLSDLIQNLYYSSLQ